MHRLWVIIFLCWVVLLHNKKLRNDQYSEIQQFVGCSGKKKYAGVQNQ